MYEEGAPVGIYNRKTSVIGQKKKKEIREQSIGNQSWSVAEKTVQLVARRRKTPKNQSLRSKVANY